jgi:hypothetical protein
MERKRRFVSISPGLADLKHLRAMGKAYGLFLVLINYQYDDEGWVNYRNPITLEWIQNRFPGSKRRTIQRWLEKLREGGYIETQSTGHGQIVQIQNQKKFPGLGNLEEKGGKTRGKPADMKNAMRHK